MLYLNLIFSLQFAHACAAEKRTVLRLSFKETILQSDQSVRKYTGMLSKKLMSGIYELIMKRTKKIFYWKGPKNCSNIAKHGRKGRCKAYSQFDEYLMTLIYIRKGLEIGTLADLFGVNKSYVSCATTTWINLLYKCLKRQLKWPSAETVRKYLPEDYPSQYCNTRTILDCTELFTVRPGNCTAQAATYSTYKHDNTVKILVGITPTGLISFISNVYGGTASDRHITEQEFLEKIEPGDAIMVDRGFNITDLLLEKRAKLHIPPFTRRDGSDRKVLTQSEIAKTREIAQLRIHVERAIERMKNYKLLENPIGINLWPLLDQLLVVVAVMCNMEALLLK